MRNNNQNPIRKSSAPPYPLWQKEIGISHFPNPLQDSLFLGRNFLAKKNLSPYFECFPIFSTGGM
jgi:hypothetical protein